MEKWSKFIILLSAVLLAVFSYGFIDPNLSSSHIPLVPGFREIITTLVYRYMPVAAGLYVLILSGLFVGYYYLLIASKRWKLKVWPRWIVLLIGVFLLAYPAFSYDIFNYILTAKVTFFYGENPYVVMPIEIPNESMLSFTRAANKLALYGPTWIALTSLPYIAGFGNILATIFSFKLFVAVFYAAMAYLIYRKTRRFDQTLFFAANPLILIEVLVSGHNDVVMMVLALSGLLLWGREETRYKLSGVILFLASVAVKGATIALVPLFFVPAFAGRPASAGGSVWKWEKKMLVASVLMFGAFLVSPFREEMYPWYAVWWLTCVAFAPIRKNSFIHGFAFWLSFALMLRYVPWIATREYGGVTPIVRIVVTILPVALYFLFHFRKRILRLEILRKMHL